MGGVREGGGEKWAGHLALSLTCPEATEAAESNLMSCST